ncbi:MAG TPA: hypothetical protein PKE29_06335 [Phycisphaerales bacterium]|nr:hypothetical protein [Phycisphaerales bacterium]
MEILFDHGTPEPLRGALVGHRVTTAHELGWARLSNGELLKAAEGRFDAMVTTDQSLGYEQNLEGRHLAILVLSTTSWPRIKKHAGLVLATVNELRPGMYVVLEIPV